MCIISLHNVSKIFDDKVVLNKYNIKIERGEFICITGASGSGKSTLLNLMGLLERPNSGIINICGVENPKLNSRAGNRILRKEISYLFQNFGLIESETVEYNVSLATRFLKVSKKEKESLILSVLNEINLANTDNKKIYQLSGGEQQRVALAKCIIKPSNIILADEPTGSLDDDNKYIIMEILKKLHNGGKTIVLVTHDNTLKKYATRIVTLP